MSFFKRESPYDTQGGQAAPSSLFEYHSSLAWPRGARRKRRSLRVSPERRRKWKRSGRWVTASINRSRHNRLRWSQAASGERSNLSTRSLNDIECPCRVSSAMNLKTLRCVTILLFPLLSPQKLGTLIWLKLGIPKHTNTGCTH